MKKLDVIPTSTLGDKDEVNEVLNRDTNSDVRKTKKVNKRDKLKSKKVMGDYHITLIPQRCVGDIIEYKLKCKVTSRPFSKVKAIITPEFKKKGQAVVDGMLSRVLKLNIQDHRACSVRSHHPFSAVQQTPVPEVQRSIDPPSISIDPCCILETKSSPQIEYPNELKPKPDANNPQVS